MEDDKICMRCGVLKPLGQFNKHDRIHYRNICKKCVRQQSQEKDRQTKENNKYLIFPPDYTWTCSLCGKTKPIVKFALDKSKSRGHRNQCKRCAGSTRKKKYEVRDREDRYRTGTLQKFGLTLEQRDEMFASQNFCCAICKETNPRSKHGRWYIDHCHQTDKIRGLLCNPCNAALGMIRESLSTLESMRDYILKHNYPEPHG